VVLVLSSVWILICSKEPVPLDQIHLRGTVDMALKIYQQPISM